MREAIASGLADRYEILDEIGQGGMAVVFRARERRHERVVAIKVLRPELASAIGADRFEQEIQIEASLNHPHVLALFDSGDCGGLLYYVAPWADEGSLRDLITRRSSLPLEEVLRITGEIGDALGHVHRKGFVHRDVKPENILFRSGHALLADFGIAHAVATQDPRRLTETGIVLGTVHYMSPEQALGGAGVDARTDQYALACIVFEMLTGDPPFSGRDARSVLARHQIDRPPSLSAIRPDLPAGVVGAINRALEKRPEDRHSAVEEFIRALFDGRSTERTVLPPAKPWVRRAIIGLGVAGVAVTALLILRPPTTSVSLTSVAVFPLGVRGLLAPDSTLGVGIAYLLEAALESAEPLRLLDVVSELSAESRRDPESIDAGDARELALRQRAAWLLRGVIQGHDDSVTVLLRLHSVAGDSLVRQASATGSVSETPLHHLALDALTDLLPFLLEPSQVSNLAHLRDRNPAAVALWMQGERRYRESRFAEAESFYTRALERDSALALSALKGAQAASWNHDNARALELVSMGLAADSLLPARYGAFARALAAMLRRDAAAAMAIGDSLAASERGWAEPFALMGEIYRHLPPTAGWRVSASRQAFEEALAIDSTFTPSLYHLIEIEGREGRTREARALLARYRSAEPDPSLLAPLELMVACVESSSGKWRGAVAAPSAGSFDAAKILAAGALQPQCAEAGFRSILASPASSDGERWGAFLGLQGTLLAVGRSREARLLIDSVVNAGKGAARSLYVLGEAAGAPWQEAARDLDAFARRQYGEDYSGVRTSESLWVLSRWQLRQGDTVALSAISRRLQARADSSAAPLDRAFAIVGAAHRSLLRGDTTSTIETLRDLFSRPGAGDFTWGFGASFAPDRLLLAQLLLSVGQPRESMLAAAAIDHPDPIFFVQFVPASLQLRLRAARSMGDERAATEARRRLVLIGRQDLLY